MQQKPIYFKTDFKVFVKTEAGFAVPFRFELYTNSPSRPFVARYDGKTYHNCQLLEDGRLLIALDQHGMGLGKLMVKQFYYLNDKDYSDGVCDRVIDPRPVIDLSNKNNPCEIILSLQGDDQIEFTTELPPYYQQGLTPEEHEALINATVHAEEAAASANEEAEKTAQQTEASKQQMEEINADYTKLKGDLQKAYADTTAALAKDYTDKTAALDADYAKEKKSLTDDYVATKNALGQDYTKTKGDIANEYAQKQTALAAEYKAKQDALAADYARDLKALNDRMATIESQYSADKAAWQKQTTDFIAQCADIFTTNEATREKVASDQRKAEDAEFKSKEAQRDAAVEEATKVSSKMEALSRDFGQYVEYPSVTLTAQQVGKRYTSAGELVSDLNWNVASIGAVVVGNTYELYMGDASMMVLGTALFVAHTKERVGTTEKDVYTPLFSAMSTDIPSSGYICFEAMEAYEDVLVSYRADIPQAKTILVRRYSTKASIATQINNLKKQVNLKSFADGYYQGMAVGTADNLTSRGEASKETIGYRKAGGANAIEDGNANIKSIKGQTVVANQLVKNAMFENNAQGWIEYNAVISASGNIVTLTPTVIGKYNNDSICWQNNNDIIFTKGYKYLLAYNVKAYKNANVTFTIGGSPYPHVQYICANDGEWESVRGIVEIPDTHVYSGSIWLGIKGVEGLPSADFTKPQLIDLTQMFGVGNEPSTPEEFAKRLGYDSIEHVPFMEYNEGTLVSNNVQGIKTTGRNLWDEQWVNGSYNIETGILNQTGSTYLRRLSSKNFIKVNPSTKYNIISEKALRIFFYDGNKQYITYSNDGRYFVTPSNCCYVHFSYVTSDETQPTYNNDICISYDNTALNVQYEPHWESTRKWAEALKKYFPDGLKSAGDVYDEITPTKAIKRIGVRPYTDGDKDNLTVITDGVNTYYALATPEEYDYDELNLSYKVDAGGTEEIITDEDVISTPLVADVVYGIDAYGTIKNNKQKIEALEGKPAITLTADEVAKLRALINMSTQNDMED